jgi:RimJ/RimL family protein N-acetyltransferase
MESSAASHDHGQAPPRIAVVPVGNVNSLRILAIHPVITTPRLLLRPWRDDDIAPFAALNADPRVMEYFPRLLDRSESDAQVARIRAHFDRHGYGAWAVEAPGVAKFIGYVGLGIPRFESHFTPCVEIGWRLSFEHWGHGYATEAARAALEFGFDELQLDEIVSFTVPANLRSRRVMERLGMIHSPAQDFDHPLVPKGHALRRHVLYRLPCEQGRTSPAVSGG